MMKGMLKRALGVAAAAAMAVAGMGVLAGTANAADGATPANESKTIQLIGGSNNGTVKNHEFDYVLIASYGKTSDGNLTNGLVTNPDIKNAVTSAVEEATKGNVPEDMDPLVWAQGQVEPKFGDNSAFPWNTSSESREFANSLLNKNLKMTHVTTVNDLDSADEESFKFAVDTPGLYLVVDTTAKNKLPMLVGTKNAVFGVDGTVKVKNQDAPTKPEKTVDNLAENQTTVTVGQTLNFTIKGTIPVTEGATTDYVFSDYASASIQINTAEGSAQDAQGIKVYYEDDKGNKTYLSADDFIVSAMENGDDKAGQSVLGKGADEGSAPTFTVTVPLSTLKKLTDTDNVSAGNVLAVEYSATVLDTVTTTPAENRATVTNGGDPSEPDEIPTLNSTPVSFTKVGPDGNGLAGVSFTIAPAADTGTPALPGSYDESQSSNDNGIVSFAGLADGYYVITEDDATHGDDYMDTGLSFTIHVQYSPVDGTLKVQLEDQSSGWLNANLGLVSQDENGSITVKNVKSITQLPATGAAGTMLFTVLGLLIAGAGVTVYMKSRSMRRMMRA